MSHHAISPCNLKTLARLLYKRRDERNPPVLLVGAGISIESGGPTGRGLIGEVLRRYPPTDFDWTEAFRQLPKYAQDLYRLDAFKEALARNETPSSGNFKDFLRGPECDGSEDEAAAMNNKLCGFLYSRTISSRSLNEIYGIFDDYLQYNQPSPGYVGLARLIKRHYFEWIISTNFDPLIEEALARGQVPSHDYIILIRTIADPDKLAELILRPFTPPRIKIIKIHGDLKTRKIDAIDENVRKFDEHTERALEDALVTLIRERDLIVIGHGLLDDDINIVIRKAYEQNKDAGTSLNSLWLLSMPEEEVKKHPFLGKLDKLHIDAKSAGIKYLEPLKKEEEREGSSDRVSFDDCMTYLDAELMRLENDYKFSVSKPFAEFRHIYHTIGMTVNKRQLVHLVVAPRHHEDRSVENLRDGDYFDWTKLEDKGNEEFLKNVSPIFFSGLADSKTAELVSAGLSQQRSDARIHRVVSDFPYISVPFVNKVFLSCGAEATNLMKEVLTGLVETVKGRKGVRSFSAALHEMEASVEGRLNVYCERDHRSLGEQPRAFYENQGYKESGERHEDSHFTQLLETLVVLAGDPERIGFTDTLQESHVVISLCENTGALPVLIRRFIPVVTEGSILFDLLGWGAGEGETNVKNPNQETGPVRDNWNDLILSVGGPEHNKILELLISLHRWAGGEAVFNDSNSFDGDVLATLQTAVSLYTESYVGGIVRRAATGARSEAGKDDVITETKTRRNHGAFVLSFSVPTGAPPWDPGFEKIIRNKINVVAVVGMSAIGSTLGVAYVSFSSKFSVDKNLSEIRFIDVPDDPEGYKAPNATDDERNFLKAYLPYLVHATTPKDSAVPRTSKDVSETLMTLIDQRFKAWMEGKKMAHMIDPSGNEVHANLWVKVVDRYLMRPY